VSTFTDATGLPPKRAARQRRRQAGRQRPGDAATGPPGL